MADVNERLANLSPRQLAMLALRTAQSKVEALEHARNEPIAIIGAGCRVPGGANDLEGLRRLLHAGVDAVGEVPAERWDIDAYYDSDPAAAGKMVTRHGAFLRDVDQFDAEFFGIAPREAVSMDPQQRLLLEVSWEALEHAGQPADRLSGTRTGVFVGISTTDYARLHVGPDVLERIDAYTGSGSAFSVAAGRLSYALGLQGPSLALDTACSSSLVAVHLACQSLRNGEADLALAGGVNLILTPEATVYFSRAGMMAPDGRCRAFDAEADGYVRGEGCGVVVLKRLGDAQRDGDRVLAIIRGSAVNHDGRSNGLTAPNGPAQEAVIRAALEQGHVPADQVGYVEAHGTGTPLGDPIELRALANVLGATRHLAPPVNVPGATRHLAPPLLVGTVKTNVGHLEAAAGVVGLLKAVLAVRTGEIPANLHFQQPTPHFDWASHTLEVPTQPRPWPPSYARRIAGVSSFGFSGTNAHVVIEQPPDSPQLAHAAAPPEASEAPAPQLLVLSARTEPALRAAAEHLSAHLLADHAPDRPVDLAPVSAALARGRAQLEERLAVVADSAPEAATALHHFSPAAGGGRGVLIQRGRAAPGLGQGVALLCSGQGSVYPRMGLQLAARFPLVRATLEEADLLVRQHADWSLLEALASADPQRLTNTALAQPALVALSVAVGRLWRLWGLAPLALLGHSVGELAAACLADALPLDAVLRFALERGALMASLPPGGAMLAVFASATRVSDLLAQHATTAPSVTIAALNATDETVLSGWRSDLEPLVHIFDQHGLTSQWLAVSHAFHSSLLEPIQPRLRAAAELLVAHVQAPQCTLVSGVTGQPLLAAELAQADYWVRQARQPVQFATGLQTLRATGCTQFVEVGPGTALVSLGRRALDDQPNLGRRALDDQPNLGRRALDDQPGLGRRAFDDQADFGWWPSLRRGVHEERHLLAALGGLWTAGVPLDVAAHLPTQLPHAIDLPTYPFQRQRFWTDPPSQTMTSTAKTTTSTTAADPAGKAMTSTAADHPLLGRADHPLLGRRVRSALDGALFEVQLSTASHALLDDHRLLGTAVLPAAAYIEMALAAAAQVFGGEWALEGVSFGEPLRLADGDSRIVQTVLEPRGAGDVRVRIMGLEPKADGGEQSWRTYVEASLRAPGASETSEPRQCAPGASETSEPRQRAASASESSEPRQRAASASESSEPPKRLQSDVRARCSESLPVANFYAGLEALGLAYGPSLRGIEQLWRCDGETLARVELPRSGADALVEYQLPPALLDASLQTIGAALYAAHVEMGDADLYLPVLIERLRVWKAPPPAVWVHVRRRPDDTSSDSLNVDLDLFDDRGELLVEVAGVLARRVSGASLVPEASSVSADDWLYEIVWRAKTCDRASDPDLDADFLSSPLTIAEKASRPISRLISDHGLAVYRELFPAMDSLAGLYAVAGLRRLGWQPRLGQRISTAALVGQLGIAAQHQRLLGRILEMLAENGIVRAVEGEWEVARVPDLVDPDPGYLDVVKVFPTCAIELDLFGRCAKALPGVLRGEVDPLQLLFPGGSLAGAERMYQDAPYARALNEMVAEAVALAVESLPAGRRLRVLEIGAGTGGATSCVLPRLPEERTEYRFTDVSALFPAHAAEKLSAFPFVEYGVLDVERAPAEQGYADQRFDIVVAANVLHATRDLRQSLANAHRLLAPGGIVVLAEGTERQQWVDLVFGLTDGWWRFEDRALRAGHPLLGREAWLDLLAEAGFADAVALPDPRAFQGLTQQAVLVARRAPTDDVAHTPADDARRRWLIFADEAGLGAATAQLLTARGERCDLVSRGAAFAETTRGHWTIDPTAAADFERLVAATLGADDAIPTGVVFLWSAEPPARDEPDLDELRAAQRLGCGAALQLIQSLARVGWAASPRVWLVTRGTQALGYGERRVNPEQAAIWGLGRVVALEHPALRCARIDLDLQPESGDARSLVAELLAGDPDDQVAFRGGTRFVARLAPRALAPVLRPTTSGAEAGAVRLEVTQPGLLDNVVIRPAERQKPETDHVEIRVHAAGLNFKDVLGALGMYPGDPGQPGGECAGIVTAVGAGVTNLQVGDQVVALAPGCFGTFATTRAAMVAPKPARLSFEEAATIPVAFITAAYALRHLARLSAGERVLIHAASGGVGLAAVQIARRLGAVIFATAGSPEKRDFLRLLGVEHIFDSRSVEFRQQIIDVTRGQGVHVVLNSLAGEAVRAGLEVLSPQGRFIELGKTDVWTPERAAEVRPGVEYVTLALDQLARAETELIGAVLQDVIRDFNEGTLEPLPRRSFPLDQASEAFRFMAQARHIGKLVLVPEQAPPEPSSPCDSDATYLVSGGLGGLGLLVAQRLVECGARHLVLVGRRQPGPDAATAVAGLERAGANVLVAAADVSQSNEVAELLDRVRAKMPPLRGIVHAAGVLDDGVLEQQNWQRFEAVMAPKVAGGWNLHRLTRRDPLDFFVLFSSTAALFGSPGQGNHAAANAFLDGLAHYRRAIGLPGSSVNWGAWSTVGKAAERDVEARAARQGLGPIDPDRGIELFERMLETDVAQLAVVPVHWPRFLQQLPVSTRPRFFDELSTSAQVTDRASARGSAQVNLTRLIEQAPPDERRARLIAHLAEQARHVLRLDPSRPIDPRRPLNDLGLDSLMAVELRNLLEASIGRSFPATLLFDYPTLEALADYLARDVFAIGAQARPTPKKSRIDRHDQPIAIIGLDCRFPGAVDAESFWQLLRDGVDAITEVPPDRWDVEAYGSAEPDQAVNTATRWGGFLDEVDGFDARFFGIAPREAVSMDPQQRLLLETAWSALERAGQPPDRLAGSQTGVFVGLCGNDYGQLFDDPRLIDLYMPTGNAASVAAGRLSYVLGLQGPSLAVDTACSSSLVAVHLACQSLRHDECRMALAGGVNLLLSPLTMFALSRLQMLAPDGRCKTFDAAANGFVRGEGCGVVVLKRLSDAEADGDNILAVIAGSATNQDGRSGGLTAPNGPAQEAVIRAALQSAGIEPAEVDYVEAHGTGTELGDPIEIQALAAVAGERRPLDRPLLVGSVKTNIGHTEAAAGVAGLIKTVLSLQHEEIPRHLHIHEPSPHIAWNRLPIRVVTAHTPWPTKSAPRVAGVSSFGFSGTNVHVVVQSPPRRATVASGADAPLQLLPLSARSEPAIRALAARYAEHLQNRPDLALADVCWTAATGRAELPIRVAFVARTLDEARDALAAFAAGLESAGLVTGQVAADFEPTTTEVPIVAAPVDEWRKHLRVLAARWVRGGSLDAEALWGNRLRRKVVLPTYPFEHERFWIERPASHNGQTHARGDRVGPNGGHALLGRRLRSAAIEGIVFEAEVIASSLAGSAANADTWTELARAAAAAALGRGHYVTEDVSSGEPLDVQESGVRLLQTILSPGPQDDTWTFRVVSQPADTSNDDHWSEHAAGVLHAHRGEQTDGSEWLYDLVWQPQGVPPAHSALGGFSTTPERIPRQLDSRLAELAREHGLDVYEEFEPALNEVSRAFAVQALQQLGWRWPGGTSVTVDEVVAELGIVRQQRRLVGRLLDMLADDGLLEPGPARGSYVVVGQLPTGDRASALLADQRPRFPTLGGELEVLGRCGAALADVLRGQADPLELLFGHPSAPGVDAMYAEAPAARVLNALVAEAVAQAITDLPRWRAGRVLEIGAGTGGTTAAVLPRLPLGRTSYLFTDISPVFLARARERFATAVSSGLLQTARLDVERAPAEQGFGEQRFDVVVAANVLHATADLRASLAGVSQLLAPGGLLVLVEGTARQRWLDLTFGLTEGWWRFTDTDLRPDYPLLPQAAWLHLLDELGFENACSVPQGQVASATATLSQQAVILARAPMPLTLDQGNATDPGWLILGDRQGTGERLAAELAAVGQTSQLIPGGPPAADDTAAWDRLVDHHAGWRGIIDLWPLDSAPTPELDAARLVDDQATTGCGGALRLVQALARAETGGRTPPRVWLVTRGAQVVASDTERPALAQAPMWGFGRVVSLEYPELWGGLIDLDPAAEVDHAPAGLLAQLQGFDGEDQVAFRDGQRYVARLVRSTVPTTDHLVVRPDGAYLIVGGLGALGRRLARWLVEQGARHLVLTGREGLPERSHWDQPGLDAELCLRIDAVRELEALGAEVNIARADASDTASMTQLFDSLRAAQRPLRGIVHTAGTAPNQPLSEIDSAALNAVLAPKLVGGWLLHHLTADLALDFFILFSSAAAVWGSRGGAHYAAANSFLDLLAHHRRSLGLPGLSINWARLSERGMLTLEDERNLSDLGISQVPIERGFALAGQLAAAGSSQRTIAAVDWARFKAFYEVKAPRPLLNALIDAAPPAAPPRPDHGVLRRLLEARPSIDRRSFMVARLQAEVARVLGFNAPDGVDPHQGFFDLGMDSLTAVELKNILENGLARQLPAALLFNYSNVEALADYLIGDLFGAAPGPPPVTDSAGTPGQSIEELLERLERYSDEEIEERYRRHRPLSEGRDG